MIIHYWLLPVALLLLWFPRSWLRFGQSSRRSRRKNAAASMERQPGDQSLWFREEFTKRRNWLDLLRAVAGSVAIWWVTLQLEPDAGPEIARMVFWLKVVILVIAVLLQSLRFEGRFTLFPPVFFVTGLAFGVLGLNAAAFALVTVWALNLVLPSPAAFLAVYALLAVVYGMLFGRELPASALTASLALLPVLLSVVARRRLLQLNKRSKVSVR